MPASDALPEQKIEEFSMEYFRAQDKIDASKLRDATFQDIGVPQQAAWYASSGVHVAELLRLGEGGSRCCSPRHCYLFLASTEPVVTTHARYPLHGHKLHESEHQCVAADLPTLP